MKTFVTIQHPAHVHFFKNVIEELRKRRHDVRVYVRAKDVAVELLENYGIAHTVLAESSASFGSLTLRQLRFEYALARQARRVRPDVITGIGGLAAAHAAAVTDAKSVVFTDSELSSNWLMVPFADVICTPQRFEMDFGAKQYRYEGFHELAYLHPNHFTPDPEVLRAAGVDPDGQFFVVRFSDMQAHHDVLHDGFSADGKQRLLSLLRSHGRVFVANEGDSDRFSEYAVPVPPHQFHHLLAHATLVVSDSSTMATESGLLGTPAIRVNSFAGETDMSNFAELGGRYGLVFSTPDEQEAFEQIQSLLADPATAASWRRNRERLLADKIDVARFATDVLTRAGGVSDAGSCGGMAHNA
jgi:predicted glycosyltransferase